MNLIKHYQTHLYTHYFFQWYVLCMGFSMWGAINVSSKQLKTDRKTLASFVQEYGTFGNLTTQPRLRRSKDFFEKLRPSQRALIRLIVHKEFQNCNDRKKNPDSGQGLLFPTVKLILKVIQEKYSEELPNMTEQKLYRCMKRLGFRYKRHPDTKNVLLIGMYSHE